MKGHSPSRSTVTPTSPSISPADSGWTDGSRHIRLPETLLLQHWRDSDRSGQMETGRVHGANREVDGDPEKPPDLRAWVIATFPIGFCWTHHAHRAQMEPTRFRRQ
nr:hypothetical protein CFP56_47524 [Quercus suber]